LIPNVPKIALSIVPCAIACMICSKIPFENPRMNRPAKNSPRRSACPMYENNGAARWCRPGFKAPTRSEASFGASTMRSDLGSRANSS
jgi:hypothetical protein